MGVCGEAAEAADAAGQETRAGQGDRATGPAENVHVKAVRGEDG